MPASGVAPLLVVDTALARCGVGVVLGTELAAERVEPMQRGHAESLFPMIDECLQESGFGYRDLGRVAVAAGPGNFTGIRVGIAAARGLASSLGIPAVGVGTLAAFAGGAEVDRNGIAAAVGQGPRETVYLQRFQVGAGRLPRAVDGPRWLSAESLSEDLFADCAFCVGSGADRVTRRFGGPVRSVGFPELSVIGRLAAAMPTTARAAPVYVRPPDATPRARPEGAGCGPW